MKKLSLLIASSVLIFSILLFFVSMEKVLGETVSGTDVAYTTDTDFDKGAIFNLNHDTPKHDQLQLNKTTKPFPFVNIAASGRGTIVRIDVNTGAILGEYRTSPSGMGQNPSRTTVDQFGNVWVANRNEYGYSPAGSNTPKGSIARVGLIIGGTRVNADGTPNPTGQYLKPPFQYNTCIDRNGDDFIKTSRGLGNILAWTNTGGADTHGGVSTAEDECIINYTRVIGTGTRTLAVDANNDVWVGGDNTAHEKVSGVTGQPVPGTQFNLGCGGYGGLVDKNGVLWSARYGNGLLRFDTKTMTGKCLGYMGNYGLGVDPNTGHIWHSSWPETWVYEIDPVIAQVLNSYSQGFSAQGLAVDGNSHVWVSEVGSLGGTRVAHFAPDPSKPSKHILVGYITGLNGPTGVAVGANGKIWVSEYFGNSASRIDPNSGPIGGGGYTLGALDMKVSLGAGSSPYNYSDMTGFVAIGSTSPQGTWTVTQDSGVTGNKGVTITWNTEPEGIEPEGAAIIVEARASDTETGLSIQAYTEVSNGTPFMLIGRFIQVRAILKPNASGESPILSDIRIGLSPAGTDVHVIDTISTKNIELDLSTFSQEPFSITTEADRTVIEWQFETFFIGQTENLSFDVLLKNPVPGEDRLVNHKLEVLYTDVNGNPVRTELGPHYVHVLTSAFDSNVSTDKPIYQANEDVNITTTITNISPDMRSPIAKITIEDLSGNIVSEIAEFQINLGPYNYIPFISPLENWNNRVKLSLDKTKINSDLTDFPVRLHISATSGINNADLSNIFDKLGANGKKIAITTSDGITQCYVEIERWDSINKEAELWVKVPSISSTEDTTLYLYYDPAQTDNTQYVGDANSAAAENVWGSNYKAVYHISQDPSGVAPPILDSSSNNNDGTSKGNMTSSDLVDGQIGKAIEFDGVNDYIEVNNSVSLNPGVITIETWAKSNTPTWNNYGFLVSKRDAYILHPNSGSKSITFYIMVGGWISVTFSDPNLDITQWHHYAGTYDGSSIKIYVDGVLKNSIVYPGSISTTDTGSLFIGWDDGFGGRYFNGAIDEVTISNIAYSDAWIKASYHSQNDNLISFGSIESIPSTQTYNFTWNTGTTSSGNYLVRLKLSENGTFLTEDTADFTILPDKIVTSKVTTDKVSYMANEPVTIISTIQSTSPNYIFEDLNATIAISGQQSANSLYTETQTIPILLPGQQIELKNYWNTLTNPPGDYLVTLEVKDSSGNILSTSTKTLTISSIINPKKLLKGQISVDKQSLLQGTPLAISYSVTNVGNVDLPQIDLSILTVHVVELTAYDTLTDQTALLMGQTYTNTKQLNTNNYSAKDYLVILRANISGTEETLAGTYFRVEGAPSAPSLYLPSHGSDIETYTPTLSVNNSSDPNDDDLTYEFELYSGSGLTVLVASSGLIQEGENITSWQVQTGLQENAVYYWRARAYDGILYGEWMIPAAFRVNVVDDPPTAPTLSSPADNSEVDNLTPVLVVNNASDPDSAKLTYNFIVATDPDLMNVIDSIIGVFEGEGTTSWQVSVNLEENTHYYWSAQADDWVNEGPWMTKATFFVNTANDAPSAPTIISPTNDSEITTLYTDITVSNSTDPDYDPLTYIFEIDTVNTFDSPNLIQSGNVPEGMGTTTRYVDGLQDNTYYYIRVKASDGLAESPWSEVTGFFVNTSNDAPTTPVLANPSDGSGVNVFTPTLAVHNSNDIDMDVLTYEFELYDETMTTLISSVTGVSETPDITSWTVPVTLIENQTYIWRARAYDRQLHSGWMPLASFMVNTANDAPEAPTLYSPAEGSSIDTLYPTLSVNNAKDPDSDSLTYNFEIYSNGVLTESITGIPQNISGITSVTLNKALSDNTTYNWRARAYDGDRYGAWMDMATFTVHLPVQNITATIDFDPNTLDQKSKGKWITVYIELPNGHDVKDIIISSILLEGTIPAEPWPYAIEDYDNDGIPDLKVKFNRAEVINILPAGDNVPVHVLGTVGTVTFDGVDIIRVIH